MTSSSSRSRRRRAFTALLLFFIAAYLLQSALSYYLSKSKDKIVKYISDTLGYRLTLDNVSFDLLRGLHLSGLSVFYDYQSEPAIYVKDAFAYPNIMGIFLKKFVLGRVYVQECALLSRKEDEGINLQIIASDIFKKTPSMNSVSMRLESAKIVYLNDKFRPVGMELWLKNSDFIMGGSGRVKFNGQLRLIYRPNKENYFSRYIKDIVQDFKCAMDGTVSGNDLSVNSLLLNIGKEEIIGTGLIKGFMERNPYVNIGFLSAVLPVADIGFLSENFNAYGYAAISLRASGPLDNMKAVFNGNLYNCYLECALPNRETFNLTNITGWIEYKNMSLSLENVSLKLNNLPLNIDLKLTGFREPDIYSKIIFAKDFLGSWKLPVKNIEAVFKGKLKEKLSGDLEVKTVYTRKDLDSSIQAKFNNIEFDYAASGEKSLKIKNIRLSKENIDNAQMLTFFDFSSKVDPSANLLKIKDIYMAGYNGLLRGEIGVEFEKKTQINATFAGKGLDITKLTRDMQLTNKFLSGNLDTKIVFNNQEKQFLKGNCLIKNGVIDLSGLAQAVKLPSLENTAFDIMHVYFAVSQQAVKIQGIKLSSNDIKINAFWSIDKKIEGVLNAKISRALLNQVPQFQKLLSISKIDKPYIDFRFLLGGTPNTMRAMWMKGEFKEKLEEESPGWIKRRIEMGLDKMIDDLSNR